MNESGPRKERERADSTDMRNKILKEFGPLPPDAVDFMIALQEENLKLTKEAHSDQLTKLPNRRHLNEDLKKRQKALRSRKGVYQTERRGKGEVHKAKRFSLVAIDLDGFKNINDKFDHSTGDDALIKVASILKNFLREEDVPIRMGGDEFMIIVEEEDESTKFAEIVARRVLNEIRKIKYRTKGGEELTITASVGISPYQDNSENMKEAADKALLFADGKGSDDKLLKATHPKNQIWKFDTKRQLFIQITDIDG